MFYLIEFFKHIVKLPLVSLFFLALSFSSIYLFQFQESLHTHLSRQLQENSESGHFHFLISTGENHQRLARQLRDLPGISRVKILSSEVIAQQISDIFESIAIEGLAAQVQQDYNGMRIVFEQGVGQESVSMVQDYIERLHGPHNVSFGPFIKAANDGAKKQGEFVFILKQASKAALVVVTVLWFISAYMFSLELRRHAYIVEQFQRKKYVALKSFFSGSLVIFLIFSGGGVLLGGSLVNSAPFFLMMLIFSLFLARKYQWSEFNN